VRPNQRAVLNLIRTRQPLSRADLARVSGLPRSTISLIVEDLRKLEGGLEPARHFSPAPPGWAR
jgi:transcriptional regulator with XRE-family HTH domain